MDRLEGFKIAGKLHSDIKTAVLPKIKPGMRLLEIAEMIERIIKEKGAGTAFPVNTSLNEVAAHYVPQWDDRKTVEDGDYLKVDFGVEVDGYVSDGAFTYSSGKCEEYLAAEKAIMEAVKVIRPGVRIGEVSQSIEEAVKAAGFGLIVNLTGHGVDRYEFHAPPTIPNVATGSNQVLEEGMVIALEPFVTRDYGQVKDSAPVEIYRFLGERPVRLPDARKMMQLIQENWMRYPFAKRWLYKWFSPVKVSIGLKQLEAAGAVESYAPLKESRKQKVAQAEHTVIVADKPVVTTL